MPDRRGTTDIDLTTADPSPARRYHECRARVSITRRNTRRISKRRAETECILEINYVSRRYVFEALPLLRDSLTSLPERTIESHKRDALQSDMSSFIKRNVWEKGIGKKREREKQKERLVSRLKFVPGNPWQRVRANRFRLHGVLPLYQCRIRLYLPSPTSKSWILTFIAMRRDESIFLPNISS